MRELGELSGEFPFKSRDKSKNRVQFWSLVGSVICHHNQEQIIPD